MCPGKTFQQPATEETSCTCKKYPSLPQFIPHFSGMGEDVVEVGCEQITHSAVTLG